MLMQSLSCNVANPYGSYSPSNAANKNLYALPNGLLIETVNVRIASFRDMET